MATWFPGYQWTSVVCRGCNAFVGWYFTKIIEAGEGQGSAAAVGDPDKPDAFYGLVWNELVQYHERAPEQVTEFS
jgi:hypothetical protein